MIRNPWRRGPETRICLVMILTTAKISIGFFIIALIAAGPFLIYSPISNSAAGKEVVINSGDGAKNIAKVLKNNGLVRSELLFLIYTKISGEEKNLKAGKYIFSGSLSIPGIVGIMARGQSESEDIEVTIPEGFNVFEIGKKLEELKAADGKEFLSNALELEGYLFPDTYRFKKDPSVLEIIGKMNENFKNKTKEFALPSTSEIIIASILEKEVKSEEDMKIVSGILWKRLQVDMLLQVDATVAYGVCKNKGLFFCDVSNVNLVDNIKLDAFYNTYARKGLPPGPISNPGLKAIKASMNPVSSDYWFYLSARAEDGRTIFSKTSAEHERNRVKYLNR